jgi:hypothetical protein
MLLVPPRVLNQAEFGHQPPTGTQEV